MSGLSALTWKCLQLQSFLESDEISTPEKDKLIKDHLNSVDENVRQSFPEFEPGCEWFNTSRPLLVNRDLKGRVTVIDFFTYCCINCMHVLPDLEDLETKYPPDSGVVVIGVHSAKFENEKITSNIQAAIQRYNIKHAVINDSNAVLWNKLEITCWPTLVILNPNAQPIFVIVGEGHRNVLFQYIESSLQMYETEIQKGELPLVPYGPSTVKSYLCFPGKVCLAWLGDTPRTGNEDPSRKFEENCLIVSDTGHHRIIVVTLQGEIKCKIGGPEPGFSDGDFSVAKFRNPQGVVFSYPHYLYVADTGNHSIRKVNLRKRTVKTAAGNGKQSVDKEGGGYAMNQALSSPWDVCLAYSPGKFGNIDKSDCDVLLIANAGTHQIWALALEDLNWWKNVKFDKGQCWRIAGSGAEENRNNSYPAKAAFAQPSGLCTAVISSPVNAAIEYVLFIADSESSSVRQLYLKDGVVKGVVGGDKDPTNLFAFGDKDNDTEPKDPVRLQHPLAVAWNPKDNLVYVADSYNHKIKQIDPFKKTSKTFLGNGNAGLIDSTALGSQVSEPGGLCIAETTNTLYIADTNNHSIRKVDLFTNIVETVNIMESEIECEIKTGSGIQLTVQLPLDSSIVLFTFQFVCPEKWYWSENAPNSWKLELPDHFEADKMKGDIIDSVAQFTLCAFPTFTGDSALIKMKTSAYFCSKSDGICIGKTYVILLNIKKNLNSNKKEIYQKIVLSFD